MTDLRRAFLIATLGLLTLGAAPAGATHIAGATYTGIHTQGGASYAEGGSISFTVADTGRVLNDFTIGGPVVGNNGCVLVPGGTTQTFQSVPIEDHVFVHELPPLTNFAAFVSPRRADGAFVMATPACNSGPVFWIATTPTQFGCSVPKVTGKTYKRALDLIAAAHCTAGKVRLRTSKNKPKKQVFRQRPKPLEERPAGSPVNITISLGR